MASDKLDILETLLAQEQELVLTRFTSSETGTDFFTLHSTEQALITRNGYAENQHWLILLAIVLFTRAGSWQPRDGKLKKPDWFPSRNSHPTEDRFH